MHFEDSTLILVSIPTNLTKRRPLTAVKTCLTVHKFMFCTFFTFLAKKLCVLAQKTLLCSTTCKTNIKRSKIGNECTSSKKLHTHLAPQCYKLTNKCSSYLQIFACHQCSFSRLNLVKILLRICTKQSFCSSADCFILRLSTITF